MVHLLSKYNLLIKCLFPIAWLFVPLHVTAQLNIDELIADRDIEAIIKDYFIGGGIAVSNIQFQGGINQFARFSATNTSLSIEQGLVMTTGHANIASSNDAYASRNNFNRKTDSTSPNSTGGDAELEKLLEGAITYDAAVIEFDFVPEFDFIQFNYVFASEEYPEFNCSRYNDIFAFLLSGPGIETPINIAKIPGTDINVAINSINDGTIDRSRGSVRFCQPPLGALDNGSLYIDNANGQYLEFDGLTSFLRAEANVTPCQTYHIKLAIADVSDNNLDSAVFFERLSFRSVPSINVSANSSGRKGTATEGCNNVQLVFERKSNPTLPLEFDFQLGGTAIMGTDYQNIPKTVIIPAGAVRNSLIIQPEIDNIPEPKETIVIYYKLPSCEAETDSLVIYIEDNGILTITPDNAPICSDQVQTIPLQAKAGGVGGGTYRWEPPRGLSNPNSPNPTATISEPITYTVYYEKEACLDTATWSADTAPPIFIEEINSTKPCQNEPINFVVRLSGDTLNTNYNWLPQSSFSCNNCPTPTIIGDQTDLMLVVKNELGCADTSQIALSYSPQLATPDLQCGPLDFDFLGLNWQPVPDANQYRLTYGSNVMMLNADQSSIRLPIPDNTIGNMRFSLRAIHQFEKFCDSQVSTIACPTLDCQQTGQCAIFVPTAFSPNDDGRNDIAFIQSDQGILKIESWRIFDRYGSLLFQQENFAPNDRQFGWDGSFKGKKMNPGVFAWVAEVVLLDNTVAVISGDITLLR